MTAIINIQASKMKRVCRTLKTLSHPVRMEIVGLLLNQPKIPVNQVAELAGISQSNASQHLRALEDKGILQSERDGKRILYEVKNKGIQKLLSLIGECLDC